MLDLPITFAEGAFRDLSSVLSKVFGLTHGIVMVVIGSFVPSLPLYNEKVQNMVSCGILPGLQSLDDEII